MMYPPVAIPELVAICGRDEKAVPEAAEALRLPEALHGLAEDAGRPGGPALRQRRAQRRPRRALHRRRPRRANTSSARSRWRARAEEAKKMLDAVKKAKVKHQAAFNYRFVPAVRQAYELIKSGKLGRIYHFRAVYLQEWIMPQYDTPAHLAPAEEARGLRRARRPGRAHHRPGPLPDRRDRVGERADPHVHRGARAPRRQGHGQGGRGRRLRVRGGVRERRHRDPGGHALRGRAQELQLLRDQRREGHDPLRPRAPQRAGGLLGRRGAEGDAGASTACRSRRRTIRSSRTGGPTATSSAGSTRWSTR